MRVPDADQVPASISRGAVGAQDVPRLNRVEASRVGSVAGRVDLEDLALAACQEPACFEG
jgi:hypothetical protein